MSIFFLKNKFSSHDLNEIVTYRAGQVNAGAKKDVQVRLETGFFTHFPEAEMMIICIWEQWLQYVYKPDAKSLWKILVFFPRHLFNDNAVFQRSIRESINDERPIKEIISELRDAVHKNGLVEQETVVMVSRNT